MNPWGDECVFTGWMSARIRLGILYVQGYPRPLPAGARGNPGSLSEIFQYSSCTSLNMFYSELTFSLLVFLNIKTVYYNFHGKWKPFDKKRLFRRTQCWLAIINTWGNANIIEIMFRGNSVLSSLDDIHPRGLPYDTHCTWMKEFEWKFVFKWVILQYTPWINKRARVESSFVQLRKRESDTPDAVHQRTTSTIPCPCRRSFPWQRQRQICEILRSR